MPVPTILSRIEGENYFVYTIDTVDQRVWERGGSFPDGVNNIRDVVMVGGNCMCAVSDMDDGTWGVIRSLDLAKTWSIVWTHAQKIYSMRLYDQGWLLLSADDGFYQSIQSGYDFTFLATGPKARNLVYLNDDILFAHDGEQLWVSIDDAITWTMIQDLRASSPNDPIRAALAAANMYVLAGAGRKLFRSDDFGQTFEISTIFNNGEYIQSISPMDTSTADTDFLLVTHESFDSINRVYYSSDKGLTWIPKIDVEFSPNLYIATTHIQNAGTTETRAILSGLLTPIPLTGTGQKYPKLFQTMNGTTWNANGFVWPAEET